MGTKSLPIPKKKK